VNLRTNRDFAAVLASMREHVQELTKRAIDLDGTPADRAKGATQAVQWWLDSNMHAPETLEKLIQTKR
jgi:hypothetical protein